MWDVGELLRRAAPRVTMPTLVPDKNGFLWMSAKGFADAVAHESSADDVLLMAATQEPIANRDDMIKRFLVSDHSGFDFSVIETGDIGTGSNIEILEWDPKSVAVGDILRLYLGQACDQGLLQRATKVSSLPKNQRTELLLRT